MLGAAKEISQMLLMEPHSFEELCHSSAAGTEGRCFEYDYFDSEQAQRAIDCWSNLCHRWSPTID